MPRQTTTLDIQAQVAPITLTRPERRTAYTARLGQELGEAYRECDEDDAVRAVVLTGAGRAFCVGADLETGAATFSGEARRQGGAPRARRTEDEAGPRQQAGAGGEAPESGHRPPPPRRPRRPRPPR